MHIIVGCMVLGVILATAPNITWITNVDVDRLPDPTHQRPQPAPRP